MRKLIFAAVAGVVSAPALAVSAVTTPGALGATDFIDWGQLGPSFTVVLSPVVVTTNLGGSATVSSAGGMFQRRDQNLGWAGNFAACHKLLWNMGYGPDITIVFASPVAGAGTQWQADYYGAFSARLAAYDDMDVLLCAVTRDGFSHAGRDGSAIFLGVLTSSVNIKKIVLTLDYASSAPKDFAINRLLLTSSPGSGVVIPEPSTWAMLIKGFGLVGLMARRRKVALAA
ncbi:PEPxxWA-CTERM sorting domain-containing protein [Thermaurantiacus sp.]